MSRTAMAVAMVALAVAVGMLFVVDTERLGSFEVLQQEYGQEMTQGYDLTELETPRLVGWPLKALVFLMRQPVLGGVLSKKVYRDNGMLAVRKLAASIFDDPLYTPSILPITTPSVADKPALDLEAFSQEQDKKKTSDTFKHWTIHDYTSRYISGEVTPVQVARAVLAAINASEQGDAPLRIFVDYHVEDIMQQARASTARYAKGTTLGVLDGVPVAIKDEIEVQGYETTHGSSFLGPIAGVAKHDFIAVARLRAQGAMIIGKTNMHEIGAGVTGFNKNWGTARNPYNPDHHTGGSSSGSSVAVASGIVPLAIGVDGGGSIRIPASLCGVVGIKPTYWRVPMPIVSVAQVGPIAGSVRDAAIGYAIISGGDPAYSVSMAQPPVSLNAFEESTSLRGLKVGYFEANVNHSSPEIAENVWNVLHKLRALGAELVPVSIDHLSAIHTAHTITISSEIAMHMDAFSSRVNELSPEVQSIIAFGRAFSSLDFLAAQKVRAYLVRQLQTQVYNRVDVLVGPATGVTAPVIPEDAASVGELNGVAIGRIFRFALVGNLAGTPGMVVPVAYDHEGLPIAVQVQGSHWQEDKMLRVAHAVEQAYATQLQQPQVYFSVLDDAKHQTV